MPKKCCGYFSHPLDVYEASHLNEILGRADIVVETRAKTAASFSVIIKEKRIGSYLLPARLQMHFSGASFCIVL